MKTETKSKIVLALKILVAIITAILGVIGAGSMMTSCRTSTAFSITADSLDVINPEIQYVDSVSVKFPFSR